MHNYCSEVLNGSIRTRRSAETLRPTFRFNKTYIHPIPNKQCSGLVYLFKVGEGAPSPHRSCATHASLNKIQRGEVRLKLLGVSNHCFVSILSEIYISLLTVRRLYSLILQESNKYQTPIVFNSHPYTYHHILTQEFFLRSDSV